jgi:arylsulfatase A-like enzyme
MFAAMTRTTISLVALAAAWTLGLVACSSPQVTPQSSASKPRPNVLLLVADDLGYSDIGAFGGEIPTPNLDQLARSGRMLTSFHTAPNCSPTRAMLMSGADSHVAGLGSMGESITAFVERGLGPFGEGRQYGWNSLPPGYEGFLNDRSHSLPQLFQAAGYHTVMAGKWHLAYQPAPQKPGAPRAALRAASLPKAKGFDRSFATMHGTSSHFAPVPGRPTVLDLGGIHMEDDQRVSLPADFYSSRSYTDKLIEYIDSNRQSGKPFFAYAAYTAPHFPLQAPDEDIARHKGRYDAGYEVIRERRLERQKALGLIPKDFKAASAGPNLRPWGQLSPEAKAAEARKMEIYAAMVENLDRNIGRLIDHLKKIGAYDNTVIVFMSDNGAHAGPRSGVPDNVHTDNSFENMGRSRSNITYGPGWAHASAAPFRGWKRFSSEGGISVPMLVRLPGQPGLPEPLRQVAHVTDLLPTLTDLAGIRIPARTPAGLEAHPVTGLSLVPLLQERSVGAATLSQARTIAGELFGGRYINDGRWKLVALQPPMGDNRWMLFDVIADRGETRDLAATHPEQAARLQQAYEDYARRVGVVPMPPGMPFD